MGWNLDDFMVKYHRFQDRVFAYRIIIKSYDKSSENRPSINNFLKQTLAIVAISEKLMFARFNVASP